MICHEYCEVVAVVAGDCVGSLDSAEFLSRADEACKPEPEALLGSGRASLDGYHGSSGRSSSNSMSKDLFPKNDNPSISSLPSPVIPHGYDKVTAYQMSEFGVTRDQLRMAPVLMSAQANLHPEALMNRELTLDEVRSAIEITPNISLLECARRADGAAAIIVASNRFLSRRGREGSSSGGASGTYGNSGGPDVGEDYAFFAEGRQGGGGSGSSGGLSCGPSGGSSFAPSGSSSYVAPSPDIPFVLSAENSSPNNHSPTNSSSSSETVQGISTSNSHQTRINRSPINRGPTRSPIGRHALDEQSDFLHYENSIAKHPIPVLIGSGEASGPLYPFEEINEHMFSCEQACDFAYEEAQLSYQDVDFFGL